MIEQAKQFELELKALLSKYNVALEAKDHWEGYPECGEDVRITVDFSDPYFCLDLGCYFDKDSFSKDK